MNITNLSFLIFKQSLKVIILNRRLWSIGREGVDDPKSDGGGTSVKENDVVWDEDGGDGDNDGEWNSRVVIGGGDSNNNGPDC
ncbi:hypothetical protein M0802_015028 [Mischocyttarus mexicanus]|nr:hypothetical protein M0802_015357 [Mischocyttarus mexicanus]KAI4475793.1 hypothetical protein M0802_015028 [Mischocyttarus mexicanus]